MAKSLTETARQILLKESDDPTPDRDAQSRTPNAMTLRPMSRGFEPRFGNPGAMSADGMSSVQDLGPALVSPDGMSGPSNAARMMSQSNEPQHRPQVPSEPMKKYGEMDNEEEDEEDEMPPKKMAMKSKVGSPQPSPMMEDHDDIELSEELENFIQYMIDEGYSEDQIAEAIEENFELVESNHEDEDEEDKMEKKENRKKMMKEHVDALLEGEELSEDFRHRAEIIFESAVSTRLNEEVAVLEETYAQALEEQVQNIKEELSGQINDYLNYVVEQWVSENEIAIETSLRSELTEDFIDGLRNLFAEHYIDIPEDKVNIVEGLGAKVEELENRLNEEIERNVQLSKVLNESTRNEILFDAFDGLTKTQAEKLRALTENIEFTNENEFKRKINVLKESYFPSKVKSGNALDVVESSNDGQMLNEENLSGPMAAYVKTLGKTRKQ